MRWVQKLAPPRIMRVWLKLSRSSLASELPRELPRELPLDPLEPLERLDPLESLERLLAAAAMGWPVPQREAGGGQDGGRCCREALRRVLQ